MTEKDLILPANPTIQDYQAYIAKMVKVRGFDNEKPRDLVLLITEEIGELAKSVRKAENIRYHLESKNHLVSEELADVFIYILDIANAYDINLEKAFREKEEKNKKRTWSK